MKDEASSCNRIGEGNWEGYAVRLAKEGVKVVVNARKGLEEACETVKFIEEVGGEATYVLADVGARDGCRRLVSRAVEVYSGLDILVNNAGVGLLSSFESLDDSIIDERISADFKSVIYCS